MPWAEFIGFKGLAIYAASHHCKLTDRINKDPILGTLMPGRLEGKIAVITGGSSGIGLASAQCFVKEGAHVFITGRRQVELDSAIAAIGPQAIGIRADSKNLADLDALYSCVKAKAGHIDILFANAGGGSKIPLHAIDEIHYAETFDRNVKGVVFTVQKALPLLVEGASIILMGSATGVKGTAAFSLYSASKAAVRNLARSWTLDLKDRAIRVNVLSPGPIYTPSLLSLVGEDEEDRLAFIDLQKARVPLGRVGEPSEVAKVALFLASDDSSCVAGGEIFVDGGVAQI
jgi:NAD(P)-dependent dehydrogenase (short-subunit alcohol dehydrogenase family)